jgi:hypothetical protein
MSRHPRERQNRYVRAADRSFENAAKFKYFEPKVTNQCYIHENIRNRGNLGSTSQYSVQNLSSSRPLAKAEKTEIFQYKIIVFSVLLCGYESGSFILRSENRLREAENWVPRKMRNNITGDGYACIKRNLYFLLFTKLQVTFG